MTSIGEPSAQRMRLDAPPAPGEQGIVASLELLYRLKNETASWPEPPVFYMDALRERILDSVEPIIMAGDAQQNAELFIVTLQDTLLHEKAIQRLRSRHVTISELAASYPIEDRAEQVRRVALTRAEYRESFNDEWARLEILFSLELPRKNRPLRIVVSRTAELAQDFIQRGYRVAFTGYAMHYSCKHYLTRLDQADRYPERLRSNQLFLRAPKAGDSLDQIWERFADPKYTDRNCSEELVCFSAWLMDDRYAESAIDFATQIPYQTSVDLIDPTCPHGSTCAHRCEGLRNRLNRAALAVAQRKQEVAQAGAICIAAARPKDYKRVFRECHDFGVPCNANSGPHFGEELEPPTLCPQHRKPTQLRAAGFSLALEEGLHLIEVTSLSPAYERTFRRVLKRLHNVAHTYDQLYAGLSGAKQTKLCLELSKVNSQSELIALRTKWWQTHND